MEVNKDEAQRCLQISRTHLESGNIASAIKFANKSVSLYSTPAALSLIDQLNKVQEQQASTSSAGSSSGFSNGSTAKASGAETHPTASTTTQRHTNGSATGSTKSEAPKREYTPEQAKVVKRVRSCKITAYYDILDVAKECEENDVKKAYRKLALLLHPDKNGAPGADEAFKLVSKAFQILSDPQKRAAYDANPGFDPEQRGGGGGGGFGPGMSEMFTGRGGGGGYYRSDGELSPEDLFNMFFGGAGGGGGFAQPGVSFSFGPGGGFQTFNVGGGPRARRQYQEQQERQGPPQTEAQKAAATVLKIAPLILFFLFSILSSFPDLFTSAASRPPPYSFHPSTEFSHERQTGNLKVPYYVQPDAFVQNNIWESIQPEQRGKEGVTTKRVKTFEHSVEREYVAALRGQCSRLQEDKERRMQEASGLFGIGADWEKIKKIREEKYEACDRYQQFRSLGYF
ncbi:hypothetical protein FRB96_002887 [Tulasnella sp. 330]|nr:hypothetical protein FRB96_002887 [Tulasnella sp. 330]